MFADTLPAAQAHPWRVQFPDGRIHPARYRYVVAYELPGSPTREWVISSTQPTQAAAEAAATPILRAGGGSIHRVVVEARPRSDTR